MLFQIPWNSDLCVYVYKTEKTIESEAANSRLHRESPFCRSHQPDSSDIKGLQTRYNDALILKDITEQSKYL